MITQKEIHLQRGRIIKFASYLILGIFSFFAFFRASQSILSEVFKSSFGISRILPKSASEKRTWGNRISPILFLAVKIGENEKLSAGKNTQNSPFLTSIVNACIEDFQRNKGNQIFERTEVKGDSAWVTFDVLSDYKENLSRLCRNANISQPIPINWPLDSAPEFDVYFYIPPSVCGCGDSTELFYTPFWKARIAFDSIGLKITKKTRLLFRPTREEIYLPFSGENDVAAAFSTLREFVLTDNPKNKDSIGLRQSFQKFRHNQTNPNQTENFLPARFKNWIEYNSNTHHQTNSEIQIP